MLKSNNKNISLTNIGAKVFVKILAWFISAIIILSALVLPGVLLFTYYYTFNLVKYIKHNKCSSCLSNKYYCDKILELTPIPLIVIMLFNILMILFNFKLNYIVKNILTFINVIMFLWFGSCLYKNVNYFLNNSCECLTHKANQLKNLKIISIIIFYIFIAIPAFFTLLGGISVLFGIKE